MKKLLAILLFAGFAASCDDTAPATDEIFDLDTSTEIELSFDDLTETRTVTFTAPETWTATVVDKTRASSWLQVKPDSGPAGKNTVTVSTTKVNNGESERSAEVTVTSGGKSKTFTVTQLFEPSQGEGEDGGNTDGGNTDGGNTDPAGYVEPAEGPYIYTSAAQTQVIKVDSNFAFAVTETYGPDDQGGWLSTKISQDGGYYNVTLNLQANTGAERTATLSFTDDAGKLYATAAVTQSAPESTDVETEAWVDVTNHSGTAFSLTGEAGVFTMETVSTTATCEIFCDNGDYSTPGGWPDWFIYSDAGYESAPNPAGEGRIETHRWEAAPNYTGVSREVAFFFFDASAGDYTPISNKFVVTQTAISGGADTGLITYSGANPLEFTADGGTKSVTFSVPDQLTSVRCSCVLEWLEVWTPQRVGDSHDYSVEVVCYRGEGEGRKGSFTIKAVRDGKEETLDIAVTQGF